jgi:hypothetical protein
VAVLVIAQAEPAYYGDMLAAWRRYARLYEPAVCVRFLVGLDGGLAGPDVARAPVNESVKVGVLRKTMWALDRAVAPARGQRCGPAFVLRTNLSSFFLWGRLLELLATLPTARLFAGVATPTFVSGAGMLMSADVARALVDARALLNERWNDDVAIGALAFGPLNLTSHALPRLDHNWRYNVSLGPEPAVTVLAERVCAFAGHFHVRVKTSPHEPAAKELARVLDAQIMHRLVDRLY